MVQIVATPDQAKILAESSESIEIIDANGKHLGVVERSFTEEDIRIALERKNSTTPRRTTQQVLDRLKSLGDQ
jgi:hypothetical protein